MPSFFVLDEPTPGLDPIGASQFDALIGELQSALGLTVVMVTHDLDSLYSICDRISVLIDKKVKVGTIAELMALPDPWINDYFKGPRGRAASGSGLASETKDASSGTTALGAFMETRANYFLVGSSWWSSPWAS